MRTRQKTAGLALAAIVGLALAAMPLQAADLTWDAGEDMNWNTSSTNWSDTVTTWDNTEPDNASFGDTGAGTVTLTEPITAGTVDVSVSSDNDYTFKGSDLTVDDSITIETERDGQVWSDVRLDNKITGAGSLTKSGGAKLSLAAVNTYTGGTTIDDGEFVVYEDEGLGSGPISISGGKLMNEAGVDRLSNEITMTGGTVRGGGSPNDNLVLDGKVHLNSGSTITFGNTINNRELIFGANSVVDGTAASVDVARSTTRIRSGATWNYEGQLRLTSANHATVLLLEDGIDLSSNTIKDAAGDSNSRTISVPDGDSATIGNVILEDDTDGLFELDVGSGSRLTVAGSISNDEDGAGVDITGGGTVLLTGNSTYDDVTVVNDGTLRVNGDNSGATGAVTVNSDATLGGTGTIGGSVTVSGNLNPGESAGTLSFEEDLTLESSATNNLEITGVGNGDYDVLNGASSNTLTLGGTLALDNAGYSPSQGDEITVYSNWGDISNSYSSVTGTELDGDLSWDTSSLSDDGTMQVIPEPASLGLLGIMGIAYLLRRRLMGKG